MSDDSSQSKKVKRLVRPRSVSDLTPENMHIADFDRIQVRVAILCQSVPKLKGVESFLGRRGWEVLLTDRISEVLSTLSSHSLDFVFISVNHTNPKVKHLPNIVNYTFKVPCVLFGESTDARTINSMQTIRSNYKMLGVVSGPMIQRRLKQILKELFKNPELAEVELAEGESFLWRALNNTPNAPKKDESTAKVFANADVRLLKKVMNLDKYEAKVNEEAVSDFTFGSRRRQSIKKKSWAERLAEYGKQQSEQKKRRGPDWLQGAHSEEEFIRKKRGYEILEKEVTTAVSKGELPESYLERIHKTKEEIEEFEEVMIGQAGSEIGVVSDSTLEAEYEEIIGTSEENNANTDLQSFVDDESEGVTPYMIESADVEVQDEQSVDVGRVEVSEIPEELYDTLQDKFEIDEIEKLRKKVIEAKQKREERHEEDTEEELLDIVDVLGAPLPPSIRSQRKLHEGDESDDDEEMIHVTSTLSPAAKAAQEIRESESRSGKVSLRKKLKSWVSDLFAEDDAEGEYGDVSENIKHVKGEKQESNQAIGAGDESELSVEIDESRADGKVNVETKITQAEEPKQEPKTASQKAAENKVRSQAAQLLQLLTDTLDEIAEIRPPNERDIKPIRKVGGLSLRIGPHQGFVFFAAESEDNLTMLFRRFSVTLWDACNEADSELEIGQETVTEVPIDDFFDLKVSEPGFSVQRSTAAGKIGIMYIPDSSAMKVAESYKVANDLEISAADIGSSHDVNFDIFTYFPINDKRIKLLTLGNHFSEAQENRFVKNKTKLLIRKESRRMFELHAFGNKVYKTLMNHFKVSKKKAS